MDYPINTRITSNSRFIKSVYSITHCWMLLFAKMIATFNDCNSYEEDFNLPLDKWKKLTKKYDICKKLESFGLRNDYSNKDLHTENSDIESNNSGRNIPK